MFLIVHYKEKKIIQTTANKCKETCSYCLNGNDCYSDLEPAFLSHLKTKTF